MFHLDILACKAAAYRDRLKYYTHCEPWKVAGQYVRRTE